MYEDSSPSVWQKKGENILCVHHWENDQVKYGKCQPWNMQYLVALTKCKMHTYQHRWILIILFHFLK